MSDGWQRLAVAGIAGELDAVAALAAGAGTAAAEGKAVLAAAARAAARLRAAAGIPASGEVAGEAGDPDEAWQAARVDGALGSEVTCSRGRGQVLLEAAWLGGVLSRLLVAAGGRVWATRLGEHGESRWSSDGTLDGPADRRHLAALESRSRDELARWRERHAEPAWTCPRCAWRDREPGATCGWCGAPRLDGSAAGDGAQVGEAVAQPRERPVDRPPESSPTPGDPPAPPTEWQREPRLPAAGRPADPTVARRGGSAATAGALGCALPALLAATMVVLFAAGLPPGGVVLAAGLAAACFLAAFGLARVLPRLLAAGAVVGSSGLAAVAFLAIAFSRGPTTAAVGALVIGTGAALGGAAGLLGRWSGERTGRP